MRFFAPFPRGLRQSAQNDKKIKELFVILNAGLARVPARMKDLNAINDNADS